MISHRCFFDFSPILCPKKSNITRDQIVKMALTRGITWVNSPAIFEAKGGSVFAGFVHA